MPKTVLRPGGLWIGGAIAAGLLAAAGGARAQTVVQEVTIIGHHGPRDGRSLSRVVSFADLDLNRQDDRRTLERRIARAARDVCARLGEDTNVPLTAGESCQREAIERASPQLQTAYALAAQRGAYAVVGVPAYAVVPAEPAPPPPPAPEYAPQPPPPPASGDTAPSATNYGQTASFSVQTVTNGPVPDTAANRQKFGGPLSNAGRQTKPVGN